MARQSNGRFDVTAPAEYTGETPGSAGTAATLVVIALIGTVVYASPAAAAGSTAVTLDPADTAVDPGANVSLDVVITDAAGGVGAYNLSIETATPEVASIAAVEIVGRPGLEDVTREAEHATVIGGLLDTNDTGPVTVARVVLTGASEGRTTVSVEVDALADEAGDTYTVTSTHNGTVSVGNAGKSAMVQ